MQSKQHMLPFCLRGTLHGNETKSIIKLCENSNQLATSYEKDLLISSFELWETFCCRRAIRSSKSKNAPCINVYNLAQQGAVCEIKHFLWQNVTDLLMITLKPKEEYKNRQNNIVDVNSWVEMGGELLAPWCLSVMFMMKIWFKDIVCLCVSPIRFLHLKHLNLCLGWSHHKRTVGVNAPISYIATNSSLIQQEEASLIGKMDLLFIHSIGFRCLIVGYASLILTIDWSTIAWLSFLTANKDCRWQC